MKNERSEEGSEYLHFLQEIKLSNINSPLKTVGVEIARPSSKQREEDKDYVQARNSLAEELKTFLKKLHQMMK